MASNHIARCSHHQSSEMKIKTPTRYHYYPGEWLKLQRLTIQMLGEDTEKLNPHTRMVGV